MRKRQQFQPALMIAFCTITATNGAIFQHRHYLLLIIIPYNITRKQFFLLFFAFKMTQILILFYFRLKFSLKRAMFVGCVFTLWFFTRDFILRCNKFDERKKGKESHCLVGWVSSPHFHISIWLQIEFGRNHKSMKIPSCSNFDSTT